MSILADKSERTPLWLIIVAVVIFFILIGIFGNDSKSDKKEEVPTTYLQCDIDVMNEELEANALSASEKYKGKYIEFVGKLKSIDSDGKYITVKSVEKDSFLSSFNCSIKNDSQKQIIKQLKKDDLIRIKGKVTTVGDILGYYVDIIEINKE